MRPGETSWGSEDDGSGTRGNVAGTPVWRFEFAAYRIAFLGRRTAAIDEAPPAGLLEPNVEISRARQVHGAAILTASPGIAGEGDALITDRAGLALGISTADCVPVLFASGAVAAAAHVGWRGLVSGVVDAVVERLPSPSSTRVWVGPCIGPCCFEVGADVAEQIVAASDASVLGAGMPGDKPRVDLRAAIAVQLRRRGVEPGTVVEVCTRCASSGLASYRRDGAAAGRNLSLIWKRSGAGASA